MASPSPSQSPLSRQQQVNEIVKCGKDPVYFMKKYAKIQHPKRGLLAFETYPLQDDCIASFEKLRFNIILKSRQLGLSTVTAAYATWYAIFKQDKNVLVIATKLTTAMNFIKKVKIILDNLPKWLLLTKFEPTKQSISFSNGSQITAVPTSPDAGRSEALSLLIVDEAAHIRDFEEIWTGLYPTLSEGGNAIIISTPNGVGGQYYRLWSEGENGPGFTMDDDGNPMEGEDVRDDARFNCIRLPWNVHPEHDQTWFDKETRNLSKRKVSQEYLCDFISSGDTFLQPEDLDYLRDTIEPPVKKEGPAQGVWVWDDPSPNRKYVISSDVSRGDSADYSTFHVLDYDSCEVVAEYMGKIPPDKLADLLALYGKKYNDAVVCAEKNTFGYFTNVRLRDLNYPRLFYPGMSGNIFEKVEHNPDVVPGFDTQTKSRQQILAKLEELIRNRTLKTSSQRLYNQLQAFIWNGSRAQASKDSHDDLVISAAIGSWLTSGMNSGTDASTEAYAMAMLKATTMTRRDSSQLPGDIEAAKPLVNPNIMGINPYNVSKPRDHSQIKHADASDFSWLLR